MSNVKKAVCYTRVSTELQVGNTSLDSQLEDCRAKAAALGLEVVATYSDPGVSGALFETRPGIQAALAAIEENRADVLVVYDLDRLSRTVRHQQEIRERVALAGGRLLFVNQTFSDDEEGELMFGVQGSFKAYERQVIKRRCGRGRKRVATEGRQPSRAMRPYGYVVVTVPHVLNGEYSADQIGTYVVLESEATWAREIFARYADGSTLRQICKSLETQGVPTPRGATCWAPSTVKRIVGNPCYKGTACFGRHEVKTDERRAERGLSIKTKRTKPEGEWVFIDCPPLVSAATWDACQQRLKDNRALLSGPTGKHLLSGMLRCPTCRRTMRGRRSERKLPSGNTSILDHYFCYDVAPSCNSGGHVCNRRKHNAPRAETIVCRAIKDVVRSKELVAAALAAHYAEQQTAGYDGAEHARIIAELKALDAREAATVELQIEARTDGLPTAPYVSKLKAIGETRRGLEARAAEHDTRRTQNAARDIPSEAQRIADALCDVAEALDNGFLPTADKRALLARVVTEIYPDEADGYTICVKPLSGKQNQSVAIIRSSVADWTSAVWAVVENKTSSCYRCRGELGNSMQGCRS